MNLDNELNALDLSKYPVDEVVKLINSLKIGGLTCPIIAGSTIQRISSFNDDVVVDSVRMLSYNPNSTKYGRANVRGVPMFYGCLDIPNDNKTTNEMIVAMFEGRALRNGISIFSRWCVNKPLRVACIIHPSIYPGSKNRFLLRLKSLYCLFVKNSHNPILDKNWKQVCFQFSKKIDDENDYNYLFTAHLTQILIENNHYDGILYPSVQTEGNVCMNIALTAESVDNKLSFDEARKSLIFAEDENTYHSSPFQAGKSVGGRLIWSDLPVVH